MSTQTPTHGHHGTGASHQPGGGGASPESAAQRQSSDWVAPYGESVPSATAPGPQGLPASQPQPVMVGQPVATAAYSQPVMSPDLSPAVPSGGAYAAPPAPPSVAPQGGRAPRGPQDPPAEPTGRSHRILLGVLLAGTALLYLWNLSRNGWANAYYSAAAQAAGESWKAWFFGSFDAANAITVDKPPAALWVMGLSVRLFGLSSWSVLVPQALMGVASVGLLYATVRRWFGPRAGLIAGLVLATTPVAALMFRFNNPDALLVLLLVAAAWAMTRATEKGSLRWIVLAGVFIGFGFLAKMLQAFLVLPGFVAMYAVAAPVDWKRRIGHLFAAFAAMVASAAWWVAIVELWPASSRPYIGGSQTNSMVELIFGYNGFGRLTGNETGSVVPGGGRGGGTGSMWGQTGWERLFSSSYGGQVAWLLPAALAMIAVLFWLSRSANRQSRIRAAALGWGGWLLVTAATISFSKGIIHEYYTVALAPAIGALVGIGAILLWDRRSHWAARMTMSALVAGTALWGFVLLSRSASFLPPLRYVELVAGFGLAAGLLFANHLGARLATALGLGTILVLLAGPAAYSLETANSTAVGSLPSAGPAVAGSRGGPGGMGGPGGPGGFPGRGQLPPGATGTQQDGTNGALPAMPTLPNGNNAAGGTPNGTGQQPPNGFAPPVLGAPGQGLPGQGTPGQGTAGQGTAGQGMPGPGGNGGAGGLLDASTPSSELTAALLANAEDYTWVAATTGANSAAGLQLATQQPVLAIGGFNGSDDYPTLAQFQELVAAGKIHYYISGGRDGGGFGGQMGGSNASSQIASWVSQNYTAKTIGGSTLYDLSTPASTSASS